MGKKSVNNLYKPMLEHSNVEQKFHKAAKGKTERPDVAVILEPTNIQRHVKNVVEQLENTAPEGYDVPHPEKAWKPSRHGKVCINEGRKTEEQVSDSDTIYPEKTTRAIVDCDGALNLRRSASWGNESICGRAVRGQSYYIKAIHTVEGKKMLETIDGIFLSGQPEHVRIIEV